MLMPTVWLNNALTVAFGPATVKHGRRVMEVIVFFGYFSGLDEDLCRSFSIDITDAFSVSQIALRWIVL